MRRRGFAALSGLLCAALALALLWAGARWLHGHNTLLTAGDTEPLEPYLTSGAALPEGSYVRLEEYVPLGCYATRESGVSLYGIHLGAGEDQYCLVLLRDLTFLSVKVSNQADIDGMDRLSTQILHRYDTFSDYFADEARPTYPISGRLGRLTDVQLKRYLREEVRDLLDEAAVEDYVRDVVVDATAARRQNVLTLAGFCAAVLALALAGARTLRLRGRRRRAALTDASRSVTRADGG